MTVPDPPVRALWLIKGLGPGGAEQLLVQQATVRHRDRLAVDVAYLLPHKDHLVGDLEAAGVGVLCLDGRRDLDPRWVLRLRALLLDGDYDVVHVHAPLVAAVVRLVLRTIPAARRPALVSTEHNRWPRHHPATRWANAATLPFDDATFAVSADVVSTMPSRLAARTEVLVHGVDLEGVRRRAGDRADARRALGVADDDVVVAIVANLRAAKAYDVWVAAAASACRREPRLRFVSVGQGPMADEIAQLATATGLGDRLQLLGYRDDAPTVLRAADVFTLTSQHEGLPVALMEALALGLPVVATRAGGIPQAVDDGVEAVLVPVGDVAALADAYVSLANDPARRSAMGAAAQARASAYDIRRAAAVLEDRYRSLAGLPPAPPA